MERTIHQYAAADDERPSTNPEDGDPVCGFAPSLAGDFLRGGASAVDDAMVSNDGAWRHSIVKYLRQPSLTRVLHRMLDV